MLGRTSLSSEGGREVPEYVEQVGLSLRTAYNKIRQNIEEAHKANKSRHDRKSSGCNFAVGDLVWLYVPAIKTGRTKKFSCLWRGPYTIIDKTSAVNYRIQLLGSTKTVVVHQNRLKTCFGRPQWKSATRTNRNEPWSEQTLPCTKKTTAVETERSYAEVTAATPINAPPAGYTSTDDIRGSSRPQRIRRPPDRYRP